MPAPRKNQYAAKEEGEKLSSRVWISVTPEEKARIVKMAEGKTIAGYLRPILMKALEF